MNKLRKRAPRRNGRAPSLPLLEYADRQRWSAASPAARAIARRFGIASPALADDIAELAGFRCGGDR